MFSSKYFRFLSFIDEFLGILAGIFIIFSTVRLCIRLPYSPLFSIAIQLSLTLISYTLINFNRIIFFVNKFIIFSYKSKTQLYTASLINKRRSQIASNKPPIEKELKNIQKNSIENKLRKSDSYVPKSESFINETFNKTYHPGFNLTHSPSFLHSISLKGDRPFYRYGSDEQYSRQRSFIEHKTNIFSGRIIIPEELRHENKFIKLIKKLRIWFKLNLVKRVLISKIWVVSTLLVTLTWFAVWEWAALYMKREDGDFNLLHWNMDNVPNSYWYLESAFQIIFAVTYLLNLYESGSRLKYMFSFYGLIDLTMTPVITEIITLVSYYHYNLDSGYNTYLHNFGLLFFGSLRFMRLFQTETLISKSFTWISEFYTVFIGIAASILALVFSFSGFLFLLEAPRNDIRFTSPFDFIYFGVATMATVGYGDFSPITFTGRILCILFIILCVTIGTTQFKRLKLSVSEKTHKIGSGKFNEGYIFFWGSISDWQLLTFCKCVHNTYENLITNVVVATPLPLKYYETVHMAVTQNTGIKLIIFGGSTTLNDPSYISKLLFNSNYTILVNDMDINLIPNFNEYIINDDRKTILMALASLNVSKPLGIPLSIQLHGSEYKSLMSNYEVDNIFYNREMKYMLIARSVFCRGLFYLISSLFHSPTNINRTKIHVEEMCNLFLLSEKLDESEFGLENQNTKNTDEIEISVFNAQCQMHELFRGMKFQIFKMKFPKSSYGVSFFEFGNYLYTFNNIFLIGIVSSKNICILNPIQYIIGDESDDIYQALVIAESLNDVIKVSTLKYNHEENKNIDLSFSSSIKKTRCMIININIYILALSVLHSINEIFEPTKEIKYRGAYKIPNFSYAQNNIFENKPFVLICGWPYDLNIFIRYILEDNDLNVVILAPMDCVEEEDPKSLDEFSGRVFYMDYTPMDINNLLNAGINSAICVIVFNFHHTNDKGRRENLTKDSQVLFVHRLALMATKNDKNKTIHIILDVSHASCLEYLDPSLIVNVDVTSKNYALNKCWENYGEFMSSYEIASGCIFVQDMFYAILAHSNTKSENSVTHDSLESILKGGILKTSNYKLSGGTITLENIPISFYGTNFSKIFKYYYTVEQRICLGILRRYIMPFVNDENKQFIIVAPQPYLVIQPKDQIYLISKSHLV